jgi:hypothetical protein
MDHAACKAVFGVRRFGAIRTRKSHVSHFGLPFYMARGEPIPIGAAVPHPCRPHSRTGAIFEGKFEWQFKRRNESIVNASAVPASTYAKMASHRGKSRRHERW